MKGKNLFTVGEIAELRALITKRRNASRDEQKGIRSKMRAIGLAGMIGEFAIANFPIWMH